LLPDWTREGDVSIRDGVDLGEERRNFSVVEGERLTAWMPGLKLAWLAFVEIFPRKLGQCWMV
jgi:hypothetical protein